MRTRLALVAAVALAASGCGGGGSATGGDSAADLVPADAALFVSVNNDLSSGQLKSADDVLASFPIRDEALEYARKAIRGYGIDVEALRRDAGPQIDVAVLDEDAKLAAGFARPTDEVRFNARLERNHLVHLRKGGWTVFARDQQALDEVENADEKLSDTTAYQHATEQLPGEAVAKAYVAGRAVRETKNARWASAAVTSHDDGFELQAHVDAPGQPGAQSYRADLTDAIPDGSVAALSFRNFGDALRALKPATIPFFGVRVDELAPAFDGEGVVYVRPGALIPEVTLVTEGGAGAPALDRMVRALVPAGSTPTKRTIEGVTVNELALGPVTILYGAVDGKLVVTDNANAIRGLRTGDRPKLTEDDPAFKTARDAVDMPDQTNGWLFLNVEDGLPLVEAIAQLANQKLPRVWTDNLRPLRSVLVYGTRKRDEQTVVAFVNVR
jgi:hypothetical protein